MPPKPLLSATLREADFHSLRFPLFASPKIDGIRCLISREGAFSRTGKLIPNLHIQAFFASNPLCIRLDGELVIGPPNSPTTYKTTRGPVMTIAGQPNFTFWVFDCWEPDASYLSRARSIRTQIELLSSPSVQLVPQKAIASLDSLLSYEAGAIASGYEGIMLRQPAALYKSGRSTLREQILMKLKRFVDDEAEIIGFEERMKNENEQERDEFGYAKRSSHQANLVGYNDLGALRVKMLTGPFAGVECKVGTGFSAADRFNLWAVRDTLLGKICTVKWFEPGSDKAPRLPSWKGFREDGE